MKKVIGSIVSISCILLLAAGCQKEKTKEEKSKESTESTVLSGESHVKEKTNEAVIKVSE